MPPSLKFRKPLPLLLALVSGFTILLPSPGFSGEEILKHSYRKANNSSVRIASIFGGSKTAGYAPYRIVIRNNTDRDRVWHLQVNCRETYGSLGYRTGTRYEVAAGSEIQSDFFVPVSPLFNSSSAYQNIDFVVTSPGLDRISRSQSSNSSRNWPSLALSENLARKSIINLNNKKDDLGLGGNVFGDTYNPKILPRDWIGYTCLDGLLIDEETWNNLEPAQRQAILEWIRVGGQLEYFSTDKKIDLKHPTLVKLFESTGNEKRIEVGLGTVRLRLWDGDILPVNLVNAYRTSIPVRSNHISRDFGNSWMLYNSFGEKKFNLLLTFIILFAFAVIVGPVNLFWFAKAGRRHRLFITTPIISLAAVIVMAAIIYFQDGIGGNGARVAVAELQSNEDEMRLYVTQEQFSRTGVIIKTGFEADEDFEISPVDIPDSPWNPLSSGNRSMGSLEFSGKNYRGDFFTSRSEQGYLLRTVRPTRSRIEVRKPAGEGSPPELFSSLAFPVSDFFYVSSEDEIYSSPQGQRIDPGNSFPLEKIKKTDFSNRLKSMVVDLSIHDKVTAFGSRPGQFFAIASEPGDLLIETHPGIHWKEETVILTGTIDGGNSSSKTPNETEEKKEGAQ